MIMSKLVVPCYYAQKTYLVHIVSDFHAHRAYSITHIYINVPFLTLCKWHLQAQLILIWIYCMCGGCLYGGVTLNINCWVKQRVTFRVRSVGVWVFLSFSIPHTIYHSFYIPPLHRSFSLWWEQVERFLRDIGQQLRWWLIEIFALEWKGTVGTGCVGVRVSCPHGLARENVAQTEASRLSRLAKVAGRKVSRACLYTSHPRIADFGCDPDSVRRNTEQHVIVLKW